MIDNEIRYTLKAIHYELWKISFCIVVCFFYIIEKNGEKVSFFIVLLSLDLLMLARKMLTSTIIFVNIIKLLISL